MLVLHWSNWSALVFLQVLDKKNKCTPIKLVNIFYTYIYDMPEKKALSREEIEEIQSLRGKVSAIDARKRFGIGTTRLYRIWRQNQETKLDPSTTKLDTADLSATVANIYRLLQHIESMQKENSNAILEILSLLDTEEKNNVVDKIEEDVEEAKEETISVLERVEKTIAIYTACKQVLPFLLGLSFTVYYTWKRCKKNEDSNIKEKTPPTPPPTSEDTKNGIFYME